MRSSDVVEDLGGEADLALVEERAVRGVVHRQDETLAEHRPVDDQVRHSERDLLAAETAGSHRGCTASGVALPRRRGARR